MKDVEKDGYKYLGVLQNEVHMKNQILVLKNLKFSTTFIF